MGKWENGRMGDGKREMRNDNNRRQLQLQFILRDQQMPLRMSAFPPFTRPVEPAHLVCTLASKCFTVLTMLVEIVSRRMDPRGGGKREGWGHSPKKNNAEKVMRAASSLLVHTVGPFSSIHR